MLRGPGGLAVLIGGGPTRGWLGPPLIRAQNPNRPTHGECGDPETGPDDGTGTSPCKGEPPLLVSIQKRGPQWVLILRRALGG